MYVRFTDASVFYVAKQVGDHHKGRVDPITLILAAAQAKCDEAIERHCPKLTLQKARIHADLHRVGEQVGFIHCIVYRTRRGGG